MSIDEATQRPWRCELSDPDAPDGKWDIWSESGNTWPVEYIGRANAKLIVRCVNSHEAWMALGRQACLLMEAVKAGDSVAPLWELVSDMASLYEEEAPNA